MISGSGLIGASIGTGGVTIDDNSRGKRLFRITSGSNPYTAAEVVLDESDGSRDVTGVYDVTAAQKVLWEVNGNTSVPANTVVEATPNPSGLGFYFNWQAGGITYQSATASGQVITTASGALNTQLLTSLTVSVAGTYLQMAHAAGTYRTDTVGDYMYLTTSPGSAYGYLCPVYAAGVSSLGNTSFIDIRSYTAGSTAQLFASRIFGGTVTTSVVNVATLTIIRLA